LKEVIDDGDEKGESATLIPGVMTPEKDGSNNNNDEYENDNNNNDIDTTTITVNETSKRPPHTSIFDSEAEADGDVANNVVNDKEEQAHYVEANNTKKEEITETITSKSMNEDDVHRLKDDPHSVEIGEFTATKEEEESNCCLNIGELDVVEISTAKIPDKNDTISEEDQNSAVAGNEAECPSNEMADPKTTETSNTSVNYFMMDESDHVFFSRFYSRIAHSYFVFAHTHAHHPVDVSLTPWPLTQLHIRSSTLAGQ
jgi:hypothetical protein